MVKTETTVIPKTWTDFPEAIRARLGREAGPQRAMFEEGHLLVILHLLPGPDDHKRRPALFWRQPSGEWKTTVDSIGNVLKAYDDRITQLDLEEHNAKTAVAYYTVLEMLGPVLRSSRGLHRALQQARDFVKADKDIINFRDTAATLERAAELLLQDAQFGLDFIAARQAEAQALEAKSQAVASHRLNILAALFLPLTTLASVFGMSMRLPGMEIPNLFWIICAVGLAIGIGLASILAKK